MIPKIITIDKLVHGYPTLSLSVHPYIYVCFECVSFLWVSLSIKAKDLLLIRNFFHKMKGSKRKIVNSLRKSSDSRALVHACDGEGPSDDGADGGQEMVERGPFFLVFHGDGVQIVSETWK